MTEDLKIQERDLNIRSILVTLVVILVGVGLFFLAEWAPFLGADDSWQRDLVASLGVFLVGVIAVNWLDQKLRLEKHFRQFRQLLHDEIRKVDTVQSKCLAMGIDHLFETRSEFDRNYSFADLIGLAKPNSRILCVGRSLFHFLNKTAELKAGLRKGIRFDLMCLDPSQATDEMRLLVQLYGEDIKSAFKSLESIVEWAQEHRAEAQGAIELRCHNLHLPNGAWVLETDEGLILIWELSFGRDLTDKRVVVLRPDNGNLGQDLFERFSRIWGNYKPVLRVERGVVKVNRLDQLVSP